MHSAPSVSYPVGRPRFAGLVAAGLWAAGVAAALAWLHATDAAGWRQASAALGVVGTGAWMLRSWLRSPCGDLRWDGSGWTAPREPGAGTLDVALDLQQVLLVRWRAPPAAHWLWLERRRSPQRWLELRRAVYSRARPQGLPPARPPAAIP